MCKKSWKIPIFATNLDPSTPIYSKYLNINCRNQPKGNTGNQPKGNTKNQPKRNRKL